jgi:hypothetical protein
MDLEISRVLVIAIVTIGAVVWLAGLATLFRATRECQMRAREAAQRFEIEGESAAGTIVGEAQVVGRPEELSAKLAGVLARDGMSPLGPIKIIACDAHEVAFESAIPTEGRSGYAQGGFRKGRIRLTPWGSRTRVEYAIETSSGRLLLGLGWLFVVLGLIALAAGGYLMFTYVLASQNPAVRAQSIQMIQAIHFLWPPFLFAYLSRQPARFIRARIEALVNNLPYT